MDIFNIIEERHKNKRELDEHCDILATVLLGKLLNHYKENVLSDMILYNLNNDLYDLLSNSEYLRYRTIDLARPCVDIITNKLVINLQNMGMIATLIKEESSYIYGNSIVGPRSIYIQYGLYGTAKSKPNNRYQKILKSIKKLPFKTKGTYILITIVYYFIARFIVSLICN